MRARAASALAVEGGALETVSTADAVYRRLREAIISGAIPAGTPMREVELAARLGVSRTPLREALARLIAQRLVRRSRGAGVEVVDMEAELLGIRHIRVALEGYAARLAASRIGEEEIGALDRLVRRNLRLPLAALEERVRLNTEFHAGVFRACGAPPLVDAIENYAGYFIDARGLQRFGPEETRKALGEHQAILAALRARDGDAAERLTRAHLMAGFPTPSPACGGG